MRKYECLWIPEGPKQHQTCILYNLSTCTPLIKAKFLNQVKTKMFTLHSGCRNVLWARYEAWVSCVFLVLYVCHHEWPSMVPIQLALPSTYRPSKDHFRALCVIIFNDDLTGTRLYFQWVSPVTMCFLAQRDFLRSTVGMRSKDSLLPPFRWESPGAMKLGDLPGTPALWHASLTELWAGAILLTWRTPSQSRREHCLQRLWPSLALSSQGNLSLKSAMVSSSIHPKLISHREVGLHLFF